MNINFNSFSDKTLSFFNKTSLPSLSIQHKKILSIVALVLGFLAASYAIFRYFHKTQQAHTQVPHSQTQLPHAKIISIEKLKTFFTPITETEQVLGQPEPGLNLEGKCKNSNCETYNQLKIIPKGFGKFNIAKEANNTSCPCCQSDISSKDLHTIVLASCQFEIAGYAKKQQQTIKGNFEVLPQQDLRLSGGEWAYLELTTTV